MNNKPTQYTHILSDVFGVILLENGVNVPYINWLKAQAAQGVQVAFGSNVSVEKAALVRQQCGLDAVSNTFFASGALDIRKPNPQFFAKIETLWNVSDPTTALFIDDLAENTQAAEIRGWQTHTYVNWDAFSQKII